ncbi:hypothetical protein [Duganella sp. Root1480D1]|uniref:hypothetical protein n=1 Tax=Duganella sp. Root1480D1 TaxID=1736471 RepID=UPI00070B5312|nr:hypothetical protein [Duganella sp. Root1480D1]KQZ43959.1 hypothetical protein ASD58_19600 [Duganella sp. Root1480D1]
MKHYLLLALLALAGCGEVSQSKQGSAVNRGDEPSYKGASTAQVAKGWTPGDKASWDKQVRERGQLQNEYVKTNR